jgi:mono/diheme cytochrome c family protein
MVVGLAAALMAAGIDATPAARVDLVTDAPVTFSKDVAPIVFDHCGVCHHPNGSAPFSLLTYPAARQRATQIAAVTKNRVMPPWKSEPGYGDFVGHRPLSDEEIAVVQRWLADGAPEGDPRDLPPLPRWTDGWQLGTPDLVVTLAQPYVLPAEGTVYALTRRKPAGDSRETAADAESKSA